MCTSMPMQITANHYPPGVGLAPHIDTHFAFTGPIISLSLGSHCSMMLRKGQDELGSKLLLLPQRSLLIMSGESRYAWLHGVTARKADVVDGHLRDRERRISLTFRKASGDATAPY